MRFRNSLVRRSSRSSSRASVTSRKEKIAASCSERMAIDATETVMRSPEVVTSSRSKLSTGSAAMARAIRCSSPARKGSGTICAIGLPGQAVARVAGHLLGGAVQVEDHARGVDDDDAVGGAVDEGAVALDGAHAALLAHVGQRDAAGALAQRLERLGAAQDHAEQRGGHPSRRPTDASARRAASAAVEPRDERAGRLAADEHREDGAGVRRAGHAHRATPRRRRRRSSPRRPRARGARCGYWPSGSRTRPISISPLSATM